MVIVMIAFLHSYNTNSPQFIVEVSLEIYRYLISCFGYYPVIYFPSNRLELKQQKGPQF